jgi:uncharacterized protein YigA (DUF484 family)
MQRTESNVTRDTADTATDWRARVLADPGLVLEDAELMRALVAASERAMGGNVVDLRGMAMERLEARLARLEETHRAVIAAAYDNLSATNQVHRAVLALLDAPGFEDFVLALTAEVSAVLRLDAVRLVLESPETGADVGRLGSVMAVRAPGFVDSYLRAHPNHPARPIVLRQGEPSAGGLYGPYANALRSEACLRLDLGAGRLGAMLALASEDPHQFKPGQGTDLLAFFGGVFERKLRHWLQ